MNILFTFRIFMYMAMVQNYNSMFRSTKVSNSKISHFY